MWLYGDFVNAGNLALAMNITNIFYCVAAYNVRAYQVSDVHKEYADSEYIAARVVTCIGALVLCTLFALLSGLSTEQVYIVSFYMAFRSIEAFIDVLHGIVHKHRRLDYAGISMMVRGVLILVTFSVLGWFFDFLTAIIGITVATGLTGLLYDVPKAKKKAQLATVAARKIRDLLKHCFPLMLVVLMITFFVSYTRYAVERISGTEALGAFATATTPAIALQLIVSFLFAPLMNLFAECIKENNKTRFIKIFSATLALIAGLTFAAVLVAFIAGRWGLELLFGNDILPYTYLLPGAMVATGLTASLWFMNVVFTSIRDIKGIFFVALAGVIVCVAAAEIFIGRYGLIGANYAMIACQSFVLLILCLRFVWRLCCKNEPFLV